MGFLKFSKLSHNKKRIIAVAGVIIAAIAVAVFIYEQNSTKVFTRSEYIREVVVQNESFEDLLDNFLDQTVTYNGTRESTEKLEDIASKFPRFVTSLQEKLGPKVPHDCKDHYDKMIAAYKMYLESVELYRKAVPKNLGEERRTLMEEAENKLVKARETMRNLK